MKILVVRRDNIGDLVITLPVFRALRERHPDARIDALVNSYNAPILEGHPDIDRVFAYTKSKHRRSGSVLGHWAERVQQVLALRDTHYDLALVPRPGFHPREIRLARWTRPHRLAAFVPQGTSVKGVALPLASRQWDGTHHHVEDTFRLLETVGISGPPPEARLPGAARARAAGRPLVVGVHASSRRPANRWREEHYAPLLAKIHERFGAELRLFWAPGAEDDALHPGDDGRARRIVEAARGLPLTAMATPTLRELITGLCGCDALVCSDGGAMHIAAALGKPIVCFFGDSKAYHWHPWQVTYRLLQPASLDARDVTVTEAFEAFVDLAREARLAP